MHRHAGSVPCLHRQAVDRALLHAAVADDALQAVDAPGLLILYDTNRISWAFLHAHPTGDATCRIDSDPPTGDGSALRSGCRVSPCGRASECGQDRNFYHFKISHVTHLSIHPMQGSILNTITGTSASSHPASIFTSGGRFVSVGVLMRERTRCFDPSPFT